MIDEIFRLKKVNFQKLLNFGFVKNDEDYIFETEILEGEFRLFVKISADEKISAKIFDKKTGEEYVLHLIKDSVGEFVGKVRQEFDDVLKNICEKCFENDIFSGQTTEIIQFVKEKFGDDLEFLWPKFPTDAIWRRKDSKKWYGLVMIVPKSKLDLVSDELVTVLNLHLPNETIEKLVDNKNIFYGYHMNKKHWISFCLNYTTPTDEITKYIEISYNLAKK